jgi:hypothetical protein
MGIEIWRVLKHGSDYSSFSVMLFWAWGPMDAWTVLCALDLISIHVFWSQIPQTLIDTLRGTDPLGARSDWNRCDYVSDPRYPIGIWDSPVGNIGGADPPPINNRNQSPRHQQGDGQEGGGGSSLQDVAAMMARNNNNDGMYTCTPQ